MTPSFKERAMDFITERVIAYRADRVVDLRTRLATETDPQRRKQLQTELDCERRELALILLQESRPEEGGWDWFTVRRDEHGTLKLQLRNLTLPVNPAYVEHLLAQLRITVPVKGLAVVSASFAIDAIEEALGQVEHDIDMADDLKRRLAFYQRVAESLRSQGDGDRACA